MPPELSHVRIERAGPRADLVLDRPAKLNPLGHETLEEIIAAAVWLSDERAIRVVVIRGEGRAFTAGADLAAFTGSGDQDVPLRRRADAGRHMAEAVSGMRPVTIAQIHGHCIGGGVVLASACDLRVAARNANFAIPEVDLGIPLAWGGVPRLVREIGPSATNDLVLTCRSFDGDEAAALGLVNRVVDADDLAAAVDELCSQLAAKSAFTLEATTAAVRVAAEQLVSTAGAWNDADTLAAAFVDPESREAGRRYLGQRRR